MSSFQVKRHEDRAASARKSQPHEGPAPEKCENGSIKVTENTSFVPRRSSAHDLRKTFAGPNSGKDPRSGRERLLAEVKEHENAPCGNNFKGLC